MRRRGAPVPPASPTGSSLSLIHSFDSESNPSKPVRPSPLTTHQSGIPLDLHERLRSFPLFLSAPDEFLSAIASQLRPQFHSPRDYILTEGDEAKAMYWLVRGVVSVTSRDGESTYAELKPGAFFGEIGILMDVPRTATIIARSRCLLFVLTKEALRKELPRFPDVERTIREEAMERLELLQKKKRDGASNLRAGGAVGVGNSVEKASLPIGESLLPADGGGSVVVGGATPGSHWGKPQSVVASGELNIRQLLKELPLFANLSAEILHFLGMNATPMTYPPFVPIVLKNSPGREIFFIIKGEVEVVNAGLDANGDANNHNEQLLSPTSGKVKARLQKGQYFGEVAGLGLATKRMATVRSIDSVECLIIEGNVLEELWRRYGTEMKKEVEATAKRRMSAVSPELSPQPSDGDKMDVDVAPIDSGRSTPTRSMEKIELDDVSSRLATHFREPSYTESPLKLSSTPPQDASPAETPSSSQGTQLPGINVVEPFDPDPFFPPEFENMRAKSRRGSLAPMAPASQTGDKESSTPRSTTPSPSKSKHATTPPEHYAVPKRPRTMRRSTRFSKGILKDEIYVRIFHYLPLHELMRLRLISSHWAKLLNTHQSIMKVLDLRPYNRVVTDHVLINYIIPFVGSRPEIVDLSNCFHITDESFLHLANTCAPSVKIWRMKSVWDITGQAILDMANKAKGLQEIDLSNCRKVSDTLLARLAGWVVPDVMPMYNDYSNLTPQQQLMYPPPGTVIGCPQLKNLTLSYCKHVTDRTMSHLALHAATRLERVDLTRCTTITDQGFQHWSMTRFPRLTHLCLADCTYLTDSAIVFLTNAAKELKVLDLSFCCALSDTATEVLSLGCPHLSVLKLSFCGSAVSDSTLRAIGLHLLELKELSVRGCVRVTGIGVEAVVEGCHNLEVFDVSQCKNLTRWLNSGGIERSRKRWRRNVRFETVAPNMLLDGRRRYDSTVNT